MKQSRPRVSIRDDISRPRSAEPTTKARISRGISNVHFRGYHTEETGRRFPRSGLADCGLSVFRGPRTHGQKEPDRGYQYRIQKERGDAATVIAPQRLHQVG